MTYKKVTDSETYVQICCSMRLCVFFLFVINLKLIFMDVNKQQQTKKKNAKSANKRSKKEVTKHVLEAYIRNFWRLFL